MTTSQHIRCTIKNCHYYGQGNTCTASEILVTSDTMAGTLAEKTDASDASHVTETPVAKATESCCKTFVSKGSFAQNTDRVTKF